ncbi:antibiotic biosynthesis monooxygenase [Pluralibacter gergoviae]
MANVLQVIAHYYAKPDAIDDVIRALGALANASRTEEENLSYDFFQSPEEPQHFVILERYRTENGLEKHRQTAHFQQIGVSVITPLLERKEVERFMVAVD